MANAANSIPRSYEAVPAAGRQNNRDDEILIEHADQGIEVALVLIAEVTRKTGGLSIFWTTPSLWLILLKAIRRGNSLK